MQPALPFEIWIAHVDLLAFKAWDVDAYTLGPQPWEDWHANGWTPNRAILELSTAAGCPLGPYDLEDSLNILPPTVTSKFAVRRIFVMNPHNLPSQPDMDDLEIHLNFLNVQNPHQYPTATRQDKIDALQRLEITVQPEQTPLQAWLLAMCRKNALPESLPATTIGEVAAELCPNWVWWLA